MFIKGLHFGGGRAMVIRSGRSTIAEKAFCYAGIPH